MRPLLLAALLASGTAAVGADQPPPAAVDAVDDMGEVTLHECIAIALRNNRRLLNARLDREDQRMALWVAEGKFWPDLQIRSNRQFAREGTSADWAFADSVTSFEATLQVPTGGRVALVNSLAQGAEDAYNSALTLRFSQPLLKGGGLAANRASVRLARTTERVGELMFERAIGDVIAAVARAYRRLVQAHRRVEISSRSLGRAQDLLATNRHLIQAGRMAEVAILEAERDVAERELTLVDTENALDAARLSLIDLLDIDRDAAVKPTEAALATEGTRPELEEPNIDLALAHRPDYLAAEMRIESAETELLLARNSRRWSLAATFSVDIAGAERRFDSAFGRPFRLVDEGDFRAGLELRVPIGDRSLKARVVRARNGLSRAERNLAELRQSIDIAVRNGVREVDSRLRQVALASRAGTLAQQALDAERRRLNLGLTTNFRVILFEDDLVRAQNSELDATIAYLNALTSLDQTLGMTLRTWGITVESVERLDSE